MIQFLVAKFTFLNREILLSQRVKSVFSQELVGLIDRA